MKCTICIEKKTWKTLKKCFHWITNNKTLNKMKEYKHISSVAPCAFEGCVKWPSVSPLLLHSLYEFLSIPVWILQWPRMQVRPSCSPTSRLSLMPSSHALLAPMISFPASPFPLNFLDLHQPVWLPLVHNWRVLLFAICLSFAPYLVVEEKTLLRPWGSHTGPED